MTCAYGGTTDKGPSWLQVIEGVCTKVLGYEIGLKDDGTKYMHGDIFAAFKTKYRNWRRAKMGLAAQSSKHKFLPK